MKKTINISIGGLSFVVEEDAYAKLEAYLSGVKKHFASYPDADEIVSDMESRMAEQFLSKTGEAKIISLPLVNELISSMGEPEHFGGEKPADSGPELASSKGFGRRLMRNPDDSMLAGVCGGISAYLGVEDPIWIRILFVLFVIFGGSGVLLYIILWIIMPEARTDTEKMQMRGESINIKNVEAVVKDRVNELKKKDTGPIKNFLKGLGSVFSVIISFFAKVVGFGLVLIGALAIAGLVFAIVSILFNFDSSFWGITLVGLSRDALFYTAIICLFFTLFFPVSIIIQLGASLISGKWAFGKTGFFVSFVLWVLAVSIFVNITIKLAPQIEESARMVENWSQVTSSFH